MSPAFEVATREATKRSTLPRNSWGCMFGVRGMRTLFESNYVLEGLETVALGDRREADYICTRFARIQYIRLKTEHDSLLYVSSWHGGQHQRCTAASYCSSTPGQSNVCGRSKATKSSNKFCKARVLRKARTKSCSVRLSAASGIADMIVAEKLC